MRTNGLLERDRERAELGSVIEASCRRDGAAALVSGPAGIGKTRLLGEAALIATQSGAEVLRAHGGEMERDFPYGVVRQLLEREAGRVSSDELQGAARLAAPRSGCRAPAATPHKILRSASCPLPRPVLAGQRSR